MEETAGWTKEWLATLGATDQARANHRDRDSLGSRTAQALTPCRDGHRGSDHDARDIKESYIARHLSHNSPSSPSARRARL